MEIEQLVQLIALLTGVPALLIAIISIRLHLHNIRQNKEKATSTPTVTIDVGLTALAGHLEQGPSRYLLETAVHLLNAEYSAVAFPLVYVMFRTPIDAAQGSVVIKVATCREFDTFLECGDLSQPINVARLDNSISQLAQSNATTLIRWDIIDEAFITRYPVCVVQASVLAASWRLLGMTESGAYGSQRLKWLDFMNGPDRTDMRRHHRFIVTRAEREYGPLIARAQRVLLEPDSDEVDVTNSIRFKDVLGSMQQTDVWKVVNLRKMAVDQSPRDAASAASQSVPR